jgi:response regulator RpfG family c-di-GMP phosphodiesterase
MNKRILLVDDDTDILTAFERNLKRKFEVVTASSGFEGLEKIKVMETFAVVVSDYIMPKMNGIEFLSVVRKVSPDSVRVLLTGFADLETSIDSVNKGNVFRFLTKPVNADSLIAVLNDCLSQYQLITAEHELLEKTLKGSIKILIDILSFTNPVIFSQSSRHRMLAKKIAESLQIKNIWEIEIAALFSQIGVITIPGEIVDKKIRGEQLSPDEEKIYKTSTINGKNLLKHIPRLEDVANAIGSKDKNYKEYINFNESVNESDLPIASRILKVVIDFDTFIEKGLNDNDALKNIKLTPEKYDPKILDALERLITGIKTERFVKLIPFKSLRISMILAGDIKDDKGNILLKAGYEITDVLFLRLINASKVRNIIEPIKILE